MTTVANYLGKFFLNQAQFAALCEVDEAWIDRLIATDDTGTILSPGQ